MLNMVICTVPCYRLLQKRWQKLGILKWQYMKLWRSSTFNYLYWAAMAVEL